MSLEGSALQRASALAAHVRERPPVVAVVGDLILDSWWLGEAERVTREAPAPVLRLEEPRSDGGHPFVGGMAMRAMAPGGADDLGSTVLVDLTDEDVEVTAVIELVVAIADVDRPVLANTP